ncbi:ATP-grasp domain-containing protein [Iocasia frigidifontis]|uniref:ATP-grasp domain-containing protein n=1 Tax=Iocasia fonsfrigidae TaxID=2682810 RepID=A0A8A7KAY5_9FIRM|nr:ATP-grasp domain-containing protein [Iocasia fonsfrigidae]QTL98946.1 ATP-grasp domain-containing protein [Iocasia fonsfrigidae]
MRLLILGGGSGQLAAIKKAKEKGHEVIVSDYYEDAPGKSYADYGETVSTFDIRGNIAVGRKYNIDGVMTSGTDQPVYTAAEVASSLNLPFFLSLQTAKAVTNKRDMKNNFRKYNIPTVKFKILAKNFSAVELDGFDFPVVIKPLDNQGQRGVFKLNSLTEIRDKFLEVLEFSQEEEILLEEYYDSKEITVSGWVHKGQLYILTVTDRIRYGNSLHIGVCTAHIFPSSFLRGYYQEIMVISQKIVQSFKIKNGPIYFQMLIGDEGIKVNEIACRIGGAYEGDFMPHLTGVDILDLMVDLSLADDLKIKHLQDYKLLNNKKWLSVQLFFARPGRISRMSSVDELTGLPCVMQAGFNFSHGDRIGKIENATERAGYFIVEGKNRAGLKENISRVYNQLKICDSSGRNLVMRELGEVL